MLDRCVARLRVDVWLCYVVYKTIGFISIISSFRITIPEDIKVQEVYRIGIYHVYQRMGRVFLFYE